MGLRETVIKAVDKAFSAVGNLATTATVTYQNTSGWDVSSGEPISNETFVVVPVIVLTTEISKSGVVTASLIFKKADINVDMSSKITINGSVYRMTAPAEDNGYTVELRVQKEA